MANITAPPIRDRLQDENGDLTWAWILFFNQLYEGDTGTAWEPSFVDLAVTGTPQFSGVYYKVSKRLVRFRAVIVPGTDTSATAGSTYIQNFPMEMIADAACSVTVGATAALGACVASSNRIYMPAWEDVSVPVTITGLVEAK